MSLRAILKDSTILCRHCNRHLALWNINVIPGRCNCSDWIGKEAEAGRCSKGGADDRAGQDEVRPSSPSCLPVH